MAQQVSIALCHIKLSGCTHVAYGYNVDIVRCGGPLDHLLNMANFNFQAVHIVGLG